MADSIEKKLASLRAEIESVSTEAMGYRTCDPNRAYAVKENMLCILDSISRALSPAGGDWVMVPREELLSFKTWFNTDSALGRYFRAKVDSLVAASPQQEPGAVCSACKGGGEVDGYVDHPSGDPQDVYVATVPCPQCDGSGDAQPAVPAEMVVFQGTTAQLQSAYFGDWSAARAWAGKNGSVTMHTVRMLGIVVDTTAEPTAADQDNPSGQTLAGEGDPLLKVLADLLDHVDRETCTHEEVHRGGAIWTICDSCGRKWADDEGGFVQHEDAPAVAAARAALTATSAGTTGDDSIDARDLSNYRAAWIPPNKEGRIYSTKEDAAGRAAFFQERYGDTPMRDLRPSQREGGG